MKNLEQFYRALGSKIKELRKKKHYNQEDMIYFGFSARHWQKVEAGKNITLETLLRICGAFQTPMHRLVRGLDEGFYGGRVPFFPPRGPAQKEKRNTRPSSRGN